MFYRDYYITKINKCDQINTNKVKKVIIDLTRRPVCILHCDNNDAEDALK